MLSIDVISVLISDLFNFSLRVMGTSVSLKNRFAGQLRHSWVAIEHVHDSILLLWLPRLQHRAGGTQQKQGSPTTAGLRETKRLTQISSVTIKG